MCQTGLDIGFPSISMGSMPVSRERNQEKCLERYQHQNPAFPPATLSRTYNLL